LLLRKVSLPIAVIGFLNWLQLAPIADQGYLDLYSRISIVWSLQSETGCCYFADHLAAPVVTPRLPISYLCKRLFRLLLVSSKPRDHLASFLVELREEPSRNAFPINDHPQHSNLAYRLLKTVEHLR
jgi:hypothetical protein